MSDRHLVLIAHTQLLFGASVCFWSPCTYMDRTKIEIALESGSKSARVIWVNCYLSAWSYCDTPEIVYRPTSSCFSNAFKYKCWLTCKNNKRNWQNCVAQLIFAPTSSFLSFPSLIVVNGTVIPTHDATHCHEDEN